MAKEEYNKFKAAYDAGARRPIGEGDPSTQNLPANMEPVGEVGDMAQPASPDEADKLMQEFKQQMRMPPGASSPALAEHARMVASNSTVQADNLRMMKELGMVDEKGQDITEGGAQAKQEERAAKASQLQGYMEKQAPKPPKVEEGKRVPLNEQMHFSKENTLFQMAGGIADLSQSLVNLGVEVANIASKTPDIPHATFADDYFPESEYAGQKILRAGTQFLVPFAGISKGAKAVGVASAVGRAALAGTLTDFLAFDGNDERLSNMIQDTGWANEVTAYLAAKKDDSALEGRLKNVIEGTMLGIGGEAALQVGEGVFKAIKFMKQTRSAKTMIEEIGKVESGAVKVPHVEGQIEVPPIAEQQKTLAGKVNEVGPAPDIKPGDIATPRPDIVDEPYLLNLAKVEARPEVKDAYKNIAEGDAANITNVVGDVHRHADLDSAAKASGRTVGDVLATPAGQPLTEIDQHILRTAVVTKGDEIVELAKKASASQDPQDLAAFILAKDDFTTLYRADKYSGATAARILGARRAVVTKFDADQVAEVMKLYGDKGWKMAEMVSNMKSRDMARIAQKTQYRKIFDAVRETYISNLLSGVGTHITNFVTAPVTFAVNVARRGIAPIMDANSTFDGKIITRLMSEREALLSRRKDASFTELQNIDKELEGLNMSLSNAVNDVGVQMGEAGKLVLGTLSGLKDTLRVLSQDPKEGIQKLGAKAKLRHSSPFDGEKFPPAITGDNLFGGKAMDMLGTIQRTSLTALQYADDFWKVVFSRGEAHATAYRLGVAQGLKGQELEAFSAKMLEEMPDFLAKNTNAFAELNTFTTPLEGLGKQFDKMVSTDFLGAPHLKMLVPFFKTPVNMAVEAITQGPVGAVGLGMTKVPIIKGMVPRYNAILSRGGAEAQLLKAKVLLGTTTFGVAAGFAATGHITGSGPRDMRKRKMMEEAGVQFNSIKIGDGYFPLKNLGPLGTSIGIAADIADIARYSMNDEGQTVTDSDNGLFEQATELASLLSFTVLERATPEGFVRNMGMIFDSIEKKDASMLTKMAANMVPITGYLNKPIFNAKVSRDAEDESFFIETINRIKDTIPGLSSTLPANKNIFGDEIMIPAPLGTENISAFFGAKPQGKNDVVLKELISLGYYGPLKTAEAPAGQSYLNVTMPPKKLTLGHGTAELTPQEYSRFVDLSAGKDGGPSQFGNKTLKEALADQIGRNYPLAGADKTPENKRVVIRHIINAYRKFATVKMIKEFPDIDSRVKEVRESFKDARGVE